MKMFVHVLKGCMLDIYTHKYAEKGPCHDNYIYLIWRNQMLTQSRYVG